MRPIVTPAEMRAVDAAAIAGGTSEATLVERAGWAVARQARLMLGGSYGRTVVVVAGPGNNGADGRVAARFLSERGVRSTILDARNLPDRIPPSDLVIDAAFGTGFRSEWSPPPVEAPVLAVDLPSGVDGATGCAFGSPWTASATVTFGALKPGLLFGEGRKLSGAVEIADIGLAIDSSSCFAVDSSDVRVPQRASDSHKWRSGLLVAAGSPGMLGAASLCSETALRAGAGIVHLFTPGATSERSLPREVVRRSIASFDWSTDVLSAASTRFSAAIVGPGLGRDDATVREVRRLVAGIRLPLVVDGDALFALGRDRSCLRFRSATTVLTPHDGEFAFLMGAPPTADRVGSVRAVAAETGSICVLKGPVTAVASPDGRVAVVDEGDERLATAGSGDVLAGLIGAFLAHDVDPFVAIHSAVWIHARAARLGPRRGLLAGDLPSLVGRAIEASL